MSIEKEAMNEYMKSFMKEYLNKYMEDFLKYYLKPYLDDYMKKYSNTKVQTSFGYRYEITNEGYASVTISHIGKGTGFYAKQGIGMASSSIRTDKNGSMHRGIVTAKELGDSEAYKPEKMYTPIAKWFASFEAEKRRTYDQINLGEQSYVLYKAYADKQKVSLRSNFPGTIIAWNARPLDKGENYVDSTDENEIKTLSANFEDERPHGTLCVVHDSFLAADLNVDIKVFQFENDVKEETVLIKRHSETDNSFQKFSGNGYVFLECHGDFKEVPLLEKESIDVFPGSLLGFTEGMKAKMVPAGESDLRNLENLDYVIRLTAPERGGYVLMNSAVRKDVFENNKDLLKDYFKEFLKDSAKDIKDLIK